MVFHLIAHLGLNNDSHKLRELIFNLTLFHAMPMKDVNYFTTGRLAMICFKSVFHFSHNRIESVNVWRHYIACISEKGGKELIIQFHHFQAMFILMKDVKYSILDVLQKLNQTGVFCFLNNIMECVNAFYCLY